VATGSVDVGYPVVVGDAVGDAVDVVGTVVVEAVLSGEDVRALRCVPRFAFRVVVVLIVVVLIVVVLMVVVVAALVGVVKVARVGIGRVELRCAELGWVVVVRAEGSRANTGRVVVVRAEIRLSDFFRSLLVVVVVFLAALIVGARVADLPARYRRPFDPCPLCRMWALAGTWLVVDVPGPMDVLDVVGNCVVGGATVLVARRSSVETLPFRRCCSVGWAVVVVGASRLVTVVGL
jgi:hypothetical protein